MKIGIVSIYPFPDGMAATNRIKAYSCGLVANGVDVTVLVIEPTDNFSGVKKEESGEFKGIKYTYTNGRYKSRYKILRAISYLSGYRRIVGVISAFRHLVKLDLDAIIVSTDNPFILLVFGVYSLILRIKSIFIFDEYPIPIRHKLKTDIPVVKKWAYKLILKMYDGYISISKKLGNFYNDFVVKPTYIMSIIVDTEKFNGKVEKQYDKITYVGNMELSKDNIDNIIMAYSKIIENHPEFTLHLYGTPSDKNRKILMAMVDKLNLHDNVFFEGRVDNDKVPLVLSEAKILVSSQPYTKRAEGGFPTKLGEYVAMGIPTLICDVGENAKYLEPGIECFYAKPNNVDDYAAKLDYIINNYKEAKMVANCGQKKIRENYSHLAIGKSMKNFIESL